ncbi:hypothetical protein [Finegoldia magna]|uniref:hypothetical protein n=1 Tax=Finegoldia magna TaxID=1260 RepID=UPI000B91CC69|nr:hypothetical protein [Finegoldia magna]OXZ33514.1 hypothetical protein B9N54_05980 [Finegoldia magna]
MPKLGYKYLNFQILVIKVYFKKISAHNLSGGADTQNFSHTQIEDYYANLLGWESDYNDINLLGSMVDSGIISYDGKILSFYVERNLI